MNSWVLQTNCHPLQSSFSHSSSSRTWIKRSKSSFGCKTLLSFKRENDSKSLKSCDDFSSKLNARNPRLAEIKTTSSPPAVEEKADLSVADKLQRLVMEFKSLEEPVERVKRLLDYASKLSPYGESGRVNENRVVGCATQVWVEAEMDENERMRFRADSDSEISKGFCSCLIWVLDGAKGEEVLELKTEDFEYVNVGLHGRGHSRVNTWHNVLITMQKKTRALVMEKKGKQPPSLPLDETTAKAHGEALAQPHVSHYLLSLSVSALL